MLTQEEVAQIMTARGYPMTRADLWHIEQSALKKLRLALAEFMEVDLATLPASVGTGPHRGSRRRSIDPQP